MKRSFSPSPYFLCCLLVALLTAAAATPSDPPICQGGRCDVDDGGSLLQTALGREAQDTRLKQSGGGRATSTNASLDHGLEALSGSQQHDALFALFLSEAPALIGHAVERASEARRSLTISLFYEGGVKGDAEIAMMALMLVGALALCIPWRYFSSDTAGDEKAAPTKPLVPLAIFFILFAIIIGWYAEGWTFLESLYFITQIITTVGYGDLTPVTGFMRLWTTFLVLVCLIVLAQVLSDWTERVNSIEEEAFSKMVQQSSTGDIPVADAETSPATQELRKLHKNKHHKLLGIIVPFVLCVAFGTVFYALNEGCSCSYGATKVAGCEASDYKSCVKSGGFVMSWLDAFYFSVVTLTTVGFGDFTMRTWWGRLVGIPWMIIGVGSTAHFVSGISAWLTHLMKVQQKSKVSDEVLDRLDGDDDGQLTKAEHHLYLLVKNGLVSQDVLNTLELHYDTLDPEGEGTVAVEQVASAAKGIALAPSPS